MNNKRIDQPAVASALDRIGARRILQRIGVVHEPASGLPSDTAEVSHSGLPSMCESAAKATWRICTIRWPRRWRWTRIRSSTGRLRSMSS